MEVYTQVSHHKCVLRVALLWVHPRSAEWWMILTLVQLFISPEKLFWYGEAFLRTLLVRWSIRTERSWYDCPFAGIPIFRMEVSQEISSQGKIVAATKFPRIYGRPGIMERPYFLGNIAASSIFCRSQVHANDHRLSFWDGSKYNILLTCPPWRLQKNGNDYFRRKSKSSLVNIEIGKTTVIDRRVWQTSTWTTANWFGIAASANLSVLAIYHCLRQFLYRHRSLVRTACRRQIFLGAAIFPKEIRSLSYIRATVYPRKFRRRNDISWRRNFLWHRNKTVLSSRGKNPNIIRRRASVSKVS